MKIYRLLEIIIILLNKEMVTARELADYFEVSTRTIQRDMNSLLVAGIPIDSVVGIHGGYAITSNYKLKNQFVNHEDFRLIITALKSLNTSIDNDKLQLILTKYQTLTSESDRIYLDYGVTKENSKVQTNNKIIEQALKQNNYIIFHYRNVNNYVSQKRLFH